MVGLDSIFDKIKHRRLTNTDKNRIVKAYTFAEKIHTGQKRYSGEPYFNHVIRVTETLARYGGDAEAITASLLHDTVEDSGVELKYIEKEFGKDISFLVDGVTKLGTIKYHGSERYANNLRHLFWATAQDLRVILIKLADRLDNIRTLEHVPKHKQKRIALETLDIYAPIANRLGIGNLKSELEDRAFAFAYPKEYEQVNELLKERGKERERYIKKIYKSLVKKLGDNGLTEASVIYRTKDLYGIYKKLLKKDMDVAKIYDLYALRVIVNTMDECYKVLGIVHNTWRPLPNRLKDYIANPKINGYQSIHTTVFTGDGGVAEIQIRTHNMNQEAKFGIAAHLIYKEKGVTRKLKQAKEGLDWLAQIKELEKESGEPEEFLSNLRIDFFESRIFVFTPKGDVIELPMGATALDFAFNIHSEIGMHTSGASVNGKYVSLGTTLNNGDIVEIKTSKSSRPTRKWLEYTKTSLAKRHIRNSIKEKPLD